MLILSAGRKTIWKELQIKNIIIKVFTCTAMKYAYRNFDTPQTLFKYDTSETLVKYLKKSGESFLCLNLKKKFPDVRL